MGYWTLRCGHRTGVEKNTGVVDTDRRDRVLDKGQWTLDAGHWALECGQCTGMESIYLPMNGKTEGRTGNINININILILTFIRCD